MKCIHITWGNHQVELEGITAQEAARLGLYNLSRFERDGKSLLRGHMTRELFTKVISDPSHPLHPTPCTCTPLHPSPHQP